MQCQKCGKEISEGRQLCPECELNMLKEQVSQPLQSNSSIPPVDGGQPLQSQANQSKPVQANPMSSSSANPNAYIAPSMGPSASGSKNIVKIIVFIVAALITFFGVRWFQDEQKWGKFKNNYTDTCTGGAEKVGATKNQAESYCSCTLDKMQEKYSRSEIYEIDEKMQSNGAIVPDELMPIITDCADKAR